MYVLAAATSMWPFAVLGICLGAIILLITVFRVHAFLALTLAAMLAGMLAHKLPGEYGTLPEADRAKERSHWIVAIEQTATELGVTAGKIAIVIAFASVISLCLMESGAADKVVRCFIRVFGQERAGTAIAISSYILSIPIFFDTFFMLLQPLARALRVRTGKDYLLYLMAICGGGVVTHSLMAPHPGPLAMAETLKIDLGITIIFGLLIGIIPTMCGWYVAKRINARLVIPLREATGGSVAGMQSMVDKPENELPGFFASIAPVILPIFLISLASTFAAFKGLKTSSPELYHFVEFIGNRNVALLIGMAAAVALLMQQKRMSIARVAELMSGPFDTAGTIILITSAGGAFGLMLKNAGVGEAIQGLVAGHEVNLILLAWSVAAIIRVAQGSATVAMLTTAAMLVPIMSTGAGLPFHPVYIFGAIGFGAMICSWMNDSGFWVVSRLSGMTEKETLRSWTVILTVNSCAGLVMCLLLSKLFPLKGL